jgi:hypothetical protein
MKNFIAIILLFTFSCTDGQRENIKIQGNTYETQPILVVDTLLTARVAQLEKHAKLQDSAIKVLALHAYHADSVNNHKQFKSDRAERRGRFLGGLLKGLIPVLSSVDR